MKTTSRKVSDIVNNGGECPLPLEVIPNLMGINLVSVDSINWKEQDNGELVELVINFLPTTPEKEDAKLQIIGVSADGILENTFTTTAQYMSEEELDKAFKLYHQQKDKETHEEVK